MLIIELFKLSEGFLIYNESEQHSRLFQEETEQRWRKNRGEASTNAWNYGRAEIHLFCEKGGDRQAEEVQAQINFYLTKTLVQPLCPSTLIISILASGSGRSGAKSTSWMGSTRGSACCSSLRTLRKSSLVSNAVWNPRFRTPRRNIGNRGRSSRNQRSQRAKSKKMESEILSGKGAMTTEASHSPLSGEKKKKIQFELGNEAPTPYFEQPEGVDSKYQEKIFSIEKRKQAKNQ